MNRYMTRDYFTFGGKPVFLFGGDFNYTRCHHEDWRHRMELIRSAGLNTICTYATWGFHETSEGVWDFAGDRDLAAFLDTAHDLGLWVILRLGPFVHAEWRNGGLPQWLINNLGELARTNDEAYLAYARAWYERILEIAVPRQFSHGGPIILFQAENELGSAGSKGDDIARGSADPEENARHVLFFYHCLKEHGVDMPIIDINHFPGKELLADVVDAHGNYIVNCFCGEHAFMPINLELWKAHTRPLLTIETMGGMFNRLFDWPCYTNTNGYQGPLVKPEYLEAMTYQYLAEGYNAVNYYTFVDGQHPDDSCERMLPERDMNYQAPITVTGTVRDSFHVVKRLGWFLRAFAPELLRSEPTDHWVHANAHGLANPAYQCTADIFANYHAQDLADEDRSDEQFSLKHAGRATRGLNLSESNFAFLFNTSTRSTTWKRDIRLLTDPRGLWCEVYAEYPRRTQLSLPPQRNKCLPFYVKLDEGKYLEYSTAELLDRRPFGDGVQLILHADAEETVETRIVTSSRCGSVTNSHDTLTIWESPHTLTLIGIPGSRFLISEMEGERPLRIVLLERALAGQVWDVPRADCQEVMVCNAQLYAAMPHGESTSLRLRTDDPNIYFHLFTPYAPQLTSPQVEITGSYDEQGKVYSGSGKLVMPDVRLDGEQHYEGRTLVWETEIPTTFPDNMVDLLLRCHYDGRNARAYLNGHLISDHYYGKFQTWEFGLNHVLHRGRHLSLMFEDTHTVDIQVCPLVETTLDIHWDMRWR